MDNILIERFKDEKELFESIAQFIDENQRIKSWPAKKERKMAVLYYISTKFESRTDYSEKEVNEIINRWHTFGDFFLLRRGLIDEKLLLRAKDGSRYWKMDIDS
jgi:hypothetical protein